MLKQKTTIKEKKERKSMGKKTKALILALVILVALIGALVGYITDFLWFKELGYVTVFFKKLVTQIEIGVPVFVVVTLLAYIYLKALKIGYFHKVESDDMPNEKSLNVAAWVLGIMFGGAATYFSVTQLWYEWLNFRNSTDFSVSDPLYKNDISLYVFRLPFIQEVVHIIMLLAVTFIIITLLYYFILVSLRRPSVFEDEEEEETAQDYDFTESTSEPEGDGFKGFDPNDPFGSIFKNTIGKGHDIPKRKKPKKMKLDNDVVAQVLHIASKQFITFGIIFFVMLAINFFLKQFDLLYTHTGAVYGAGFTDVNVTLWVYRALIVFALVSAITFAIGVKKRELKAMFILPLIMIVIYAAGFGGETLVQNYIVSPDELSKESQYLENNLEYTRMAYALDDVTVKSFSASKNLDGKDIENNQETITNVRINDYTPTNKLYNQTQAIRQYYDFNDVDVDRYYINGEYTQTFLSAREINEESISNTWINTHLKYTHGYGVALSRVDTVTSSGQADVLIGNIPPESNIEEIQIKNPAVYFGELTNNWVLVNTDEKEFDYPDGDSNQYTTYDGKAGIKMNLVNRVLFAIQERSLKLLVSSNISGDSKIIINRNIVRRVKKIMPYLKYDSDPYMVTVDGNLYWIVDAYTTSSHYPYSEPYSENSPTNYIRNSVKVVIDAYNGSADYYIVDSADPIAQTMKKIYPKLFKDVKDMDEDLQAHLRYPNQMFDIQATVYERYHMSDVSVFYQNEDLWSIADEMYGAEEQEMVPNYYILKLPGEKNAEFVNSIPYTPKNKKNMTSLLMARNDGEHYGELILYQFPKSKTVYGPMQVEALIDQNTEISKDFSLWSSNGTSYSRGNLFVIPIEDSILYVEPVYLEANNSSIPEVKKVIVVFGDQIAYESTFSDALASMFGTSSKGNETDDEGGSGEMTQAEIIAAAQAAYDKAVAAQKAGNWADYGKYLKKLEKYLGQLK